MLLKARPHFGNKRRRREIYLSVSPSVTTSIALAGGEVLVDQKEAFLYSWELEPCRIHKSPPFLLLQKSLRYYISTTNALFAKLEFKICSI